MMATGVASSRKSGFTMIEVLASLLIISVLLSATAVGITGAQRSAKLAKSRDTARQVATAWSIYLLDNRSFPKQNTLSTGALPSGATPSGGPFFPMNHSNMDKLNSSGSGKSYLEFSNKELAKGASSAKVCDAWDNPIYFALDFDYDGKIDSPSKEATGKVMAVKASAMAVSFGDPHYKYAKPTKWAVAWQ